MLLSMLATSNINPVTDTNLFLSEVTGRDSQLDLILALTQKMLQMAEQLQWENVSKLEAERSNLIYAFFETKPTVDEAERVASIILEVLAADKEIIALSSSEQQKLLKSSQKMNLGKQASKAYSMSNK